MNRIACAVATALLLSLAILSGCTTDEDQRLIARSRRAFGTIPQHTADQPELVSLGRDLYFSPQLSINGKQSCNTCHPVDGPAAGADRRPTSPGALGTAGRRNTPTVLNVAFHGLQFWDGRARTLEEQAVGPILNPAEMAMPDARAVEQRLRAGVVASPAKFRAAFPDDRDPFTLQHAARAIAAFERTLRTVDRFDRFQDGDARALTAHEKKGVALFMQYGCTSCHNGPLLGGNRLQKIGIVNAYHNRSDRGRFEVTGSEIDDFVFKVPALRNVGLTAPYFHDGTVPTLADAVDRMAWHQLGMRLDPAERDAIVAFLGSLSGTPVR